MSEEPSKKTSSVQVNVRIPPAWLRDLKALAERATSSSGTLYTAQDMIRNAIELAYDELIKRYRYQK